MATRLEGALLSLEESGSIIDDGEPYALLEYMTHTVSMMSKSSSGESSR